MQFLRFPEGGPVEAGVWVKAAEVAAWLDGIGFDDLGDLMREVEDAPASEVRHFLDGGASASHGML